MQPEPTRLYNPWTHILESEEALADLAKKDITPEDVKAMDLNELGELIEEMLK